MKPDKSIFPNSLTSLNLLAGILGIVCALDGAPDRAFFLMLAAAGFDFFDGMVARALGVPPTVGKELDSLADVVSFGVLPAVLLMSTMKGLGAAFPYFYLPLILAPMSALRLARFNVDTRQSENFLGVPTPTSAMLCASLCLFIAENPGTLPHRWAATPWFLPLVALGLGLLLLSEIPMFGMKAGKGHKLMDAKRVAFLLGAALSIAAALLLKGSWSLAVLLVFGLYVVENLILYLLPTKR